VAATYVFPEVLLSALDAEGEAEAQSGRPGTRPPTRRDLVERLLWEALDARAALRAADDDEAREEIARRR
jgi:hypothetical protein